MTLSWPWGKNPVTYNPNLFHNVYLGWALPDVINVLVIGQNITSVCYFVHCAMWDSTDTRVIWRGGGASKKPSNPKCYLCNLSGVFLWDLGMFQDIVYISSEHHVSKNNKKKLFSTVLRRYDLVVTLRWPPHDLWITPLWNPTPTHVTICTWVGLDRFIGSAGPIIYLKEIFLNKTPFHWQCVYATLSYHPRGQGYHTSMTPGGLVIVCIDCSLSCFNNFFVLNLYDFVYY